MEEILASIRRIIADDDAGKAASHRCGKPSSTVCRTGKTRNSSPRRGRSCGPGTVRHQ